jgi:hypothetical protein
MFSYVFFLFFLFFGNGIGKKKQFFIFVPMGDKIFFIFCESRKAYVGVYCVFVPMGCYHHFTFVLSMGFYFFYFCVIDCFLFLCYRLFFIFVLSMGGGTTQFFFLLYFSCSFVVIPSTYTYVRFTHNLFKNFWKGLYGIFLYEPLCFMSSRNRLVDLE